MSKKTSIENVEDFINSIPDFPRDSLKISDSSQKLLELVYNKAINFSKKYLKPPLKPPLIISFHPKASLLNNNIHETYLATKIAEKIGMAPLWIPYIYDTGFKSAGQKIRRPTYVYFEGKHVPLRTSAAIRGNIMATEKALTEREVKTFFRELGKHLNSNLTRFKTILNKFNFGHYLFDLKKQTSPISKKSLNSKITKLENLWLNAIKNTKKLDESLTKISVAQFKDFGINIGAVMMDDILTELVKIVFSEVLETPSVKNDPSILEDLFLAYNLESRERTPIIYAGEQKFIAFDDNAIRIFDGTFDDLIDGLKSHKVLPTGNLIMVLFTALGCKLVLGGAHTVDYYPDYFIKSHKILKETSFNSRMQLLCYGRIRFMNLHNMTDIMAAIRIFDKVGSRNYIQKGIFTLPIDVVDHLNFLAGSSYVPNEYIEILKEIKKNQANDKPSALIKEEERYNTVMEIVSKDPEELLKDPSELKKWIKSTKFEGLHPVRLEVLLENLRLDVEMRLRLLKENINFEQHILGGTIGEGEEGEKIYGGILDRSNRYPTLMELVFYDCKPLNKFELGGILKDHESEWIWKEFIHEIPEEKSLEYSDYQSVFEDLIKTDYIAPFFKFKK